MIDSRRTILLQVLGQCIAERPARESADAAVIEIVSDELTAWYQQFEQRAGDGDVLYMALLAEYDQRSDVLISSSKTVLSLSRAGLVDLAALAVSLGVLETAFDQIDSQWDALEAPGTAPTTEVGSV